MESGATSQELSDCPPQDEFVEGAETETVGPLAPAHLSTIGAAHSSFGGGGAHSSFGGGGAHSSLGGGGAHVHSSFGGGAQSLDGQMKRLALAPISIIFAKVPGWTSESCRCWNVTCYNHWLFNRPR